MECEHTNTFVDNVKIIDDKLFMFWHKIDE